MKKMALLVALSTCLLCQAQIDKNAILTFYKTYDTAGLLTLIQNSQKENLATYTKTENDTAQVIAELCQSVVKSSFGSSEYYFILRNKPKVYIGDSIIPFTQKQQHVFFNNRIIIDSEFSYQVMLFLGRDPRDKYNSPYFVSHPNKKPSDRKISKEQNEYNKRQKFINSVFHFNYNINSIEFSPLMDEAIVHNSGGDFYYEFSNNNWHQGNTEHIKYPKFQNLVFYLSPVKITSNNN